MMKHPKRNAAIVGVGAAVACAVCLVPLAVPLVVGTLGIGAAGAGYWVIGGLMVLAAGLLALRKLGWFKPSGGECCGEE